MLPCGTQHTIHCGHAIMPCDDRSVMRRCVLPRSQARPGPWGQLEAGGDKEAVLKRRNDSVDRAHARIEAARQQRLERKQKEER